MKKPNKKEVGERIAKAISSHKLRKGKLAAKIGVKPGTITRYVNGEQIPDRDILPRLAAEIGMTQEQILYGNDSTAPQKVEVVRDAPNVFYSSNTDFLVSELKECREEIKRLKAVIEASQKEKSATLIPEKKL